MNKEEHYNLARKIQAQATAVLSKTFTTNGIDHENWQEYKRLSKEANKHFGISNAMWTRETNKNS